GCICNCIEVAAQRLQCVALLINLFSGTEAEPPQNRERRAPSLHCMLEEEPGHQGRERQPSAIDGGAKKNARESEARSIRLKRPFYVPFPIELVEPGGNFLDVFRVVGDPSFCLFPDPPINRIRRMGWNAL